MQNPFITYTYEKANQPKDQTSGDIFSNVSQTNQLFPMMGSQKSKNKQRKVEEVPIVDDKAQQKGEGYQYPIRIPLVNTTSKHYQTQFPVKIYFYFYSKKPQEYWKKKGAEIHFQKQAF